VSRADIQLVRTRYTVPPVTGVMHECKDNDTVMPAGILFVPSCVSPSLSVPTDIAGTDPAFLTGVFIWRQELSKPAGL